MRTIVIFCHHFTPAFKGGGPIQSINNLVEILKREFNIFIFCSAMDMGEKAPMNGVITDQWNLLPSGVKVFYSRPVHIKHVLSILKECNPDFVYINGIFSFSFNLIPLLLAKINAYRVVIAPRGMLQKGALSLKPVRKKIFLRALKLFGFHREVIWHATDGQEKLDIETNFGSESIIKIAPNIPRPPVPVHKTRTKQIGQLRMVYLSLITEKKNLHLILLALRDIKDAVQLDIYGPIKDVKYWKRCEELISGLPHPVRYIDSVLPSQVQRVLSTYDVFVLPTKGENFGHAIYESFCAGTPAIISKFTPWGELQSQDLGITVDLDDDSSLSRAIEEFLFYDDQKLSKLSMASNNFAFRFFNNTNWSEIYSKLFN